MNHDEMCKKIEKIFVKILKTHKEGQKEYAEIEDVFSNFKKIGKNVNVSKEKVLLVYLLKHIDGISSYIDGHEMQREDIRGRITDALVYLCLLWGMAKDKKSDIDAFFDEHGFTPTKTPNGSKFNPATGEVSYQSLGDETV